MKPMGWQENDTILQLEHQMDLSLPDARLPYAHQLALSPRIPL